MRQLCRAGFLALVCAGVVSLLFSLPVLAADCEAQASGDWQNAATWTSCGGDIPQTGDNVTIFGHSISVSGAIPRLASFRLEAGLLIASAGVDLVIETSRDISVVGGSTINADSGSILFAANIGGTPLTGDFAGIVLQGTTMTSAGDLVLLGRGSDDAGTTDHDGVRLLNACSLFAGGGIEIEGVGGVSAGGSGGITSDGSPHQLIGGGSVSLTGVVDDPGRHGVSMVGATIDGASGVTIEGIPGVVEAAGTTLSSASGNIVISGTGAGSAGAGEIDGVDVENASITTVGDLTIVGEAGAGSAGDNDGVEIAGAAFSVAGSMVVTGTGGGGDGAGNDGVEGAGPAISVPGDLVFEGTAGTGAGGGHYGLLLGARNLISIGGGVFLTGVGGTERNGVSIFGAAIDGASGVTIEGIPGVIEAAGTTLSSASGNIVISGTGAGSAGVGEIDGVDVENASITTGGDLTIAGEAGAGSAGDNDGVEAQLLASSIGGSVTIIGWAGSGVGGDHDGVEVANLAAGGSISISGYGGIDGFMNDGVEVLGTVDSAGALVIRAYGGYGEGDNRGATLAAGGVLRSVGPLTVRGYGGGGPAGTNYGVFVDADSEIDNGCPALLWGVAGESTSQEDGVVVEPGAIITNPECLDIVVLLFADDFERGHLLSWERVEP